MKGASKQQPRWIITDCTRLENMGVVAKYDGSCESERSDRGEFDWMVEIGRVMRFCVVLVAILKRKLRINVLGFLRKMLVECRRFLRRFLLLEHCPLRSVSIHKRNS